MAVYNEKTRELIENPDLSKGYVYPGKILLSDSDNSTELEGTDGLKVYHSDPVYEDCQFYHEYTPEEVSLTLLKTSYSVQQTSPSLSYKITTVYLNDYDVEGPDHVICFGTWGSYGIEQLQVIRGAGWEDLTIKATFNVKGTKTAVVVPDTGLINVPPEATRYPLDAKNPGYIVFTGVANGVQRNSKNLMFLVYGHAEVDLMSAQKTPSEWEQFVTQIKEYTDASEERVKKYSESAATSAEAAKTARDGAEAAFEQADEILAKSLRTLHGGVVKPDTTGDFDPSRPYESESAASVTVKAKSDRFMGAKVSGFTTQSGTGDPSPDNVREISTAGFKLKTAVLDGSADENWITSPAANGVYRWGINAGGILNILPSLNSVAATIFSTRYKSTPVDKTYQGVLGMSVDTTGNLRIYDPDCNSDLAAWKNKLSQNPLTIWYTPADESRATDLYVPIQAQGHEYRCEMLKLTAPLCDGDKVENNVPSGCDKRIVYDGSDDEQWELSGSGTKKFFAIYSQLVDIDTENRFLLSNQYLPTYTTALGSQNGISNYNESLYVQNMDISDVNSWKSYLATHPLTIYYRSTAYTEANDIPVALETHQQAVMALDGNEPFMSSGTVGSLGFYCFLNLENANTGGIQKEAICSHLKNSKTPLFAEHGDTHVNQFCIGDANTPRFVFSHSVLGTSASSSTTDCIRAVRSYLSAQYSAGTPVTVVYKLSIPTVYVHDPVDLVPVPYTEEDTTVAQQLASTPSMLPYYDSADIPMLLNEDDTAETTEESSTSVNAEVSSAQNMVTSPVEFSIQNRSNALGESTIPNIPVTLDIPRSTVVAGTFVLSSQEGTTISAIFYAFQDHGDAKTLCGKTLEDIKNGPVDFVGGAGIFDGLYMGPVPFDEIEISSCKDGDILAIYLDSNTGVRTVNFAFTQSSGVHCVLTCKSDNVTDEDIVIKATVYTDRIHIDSVISGGSESFHVTWAGAYLLCRTS